MKKVLAILLAMVFCMSAFAACGGNSGGTSAPASSEQGSAAESQQSAPPSSTSSDGAPVPLVFWHSMGGRNGEAIDALVESFNASQSDYVVETQYQSNYDDAITKLRSTPKGSGPDIMQLYDIGLRWMIDSGYSLRVQDFVDRDNYDISDIEPNIAAYYTMDGVLYGLPFNSSTPCIVYNKEALEAAGVDPLTDLGDFEAIKAAAQKVVDAGICDIGVAIPNYGWLFEQWVLKQDSDYVDNGNGRADRATKVVFDSTGAGEKIVAAWQDIVKQPYAAHLGDTDATKLVFGQGGVAIIMESCAVYANMQSAADGQFNVGLAPLPNISASDTGGPSVGGGALYIMDNGDDARANGAWEFIKFAATPDEQANWSMRTGYLPISRGATEVDVYKDYVNNENPDFMLIIEALRGSRPDRAGAVMGVFTRARKIVQDEIEVAINNPDLNPADVVNKIASQINDEIEVYNKTNK